MKRYKNNLITAVVFLMALSIGISSCKKEEYSENYDIDWPLPTITDFSPKQGLVGNDLTITGSNFVNIKEVKVGGMVCNVVSESSTELVVSLPRFMSSGPVEVINTYKRYSVTEDNFTPEFPETKITDWPSVIYVDQPFLIKGENLDLITSLTIGDSLFVFKGEGSQDVMKVTIKGLPLGTETQITSVTCKAGNPIDDSPVIPVEEKVILPPGSNPILMFDFEDNVNRYTPWTGSPIHGDEESGINISGIAAYENGGGSKYQTVRVSDITSDWSYFGEVAYGDKAGIADYTAIDLSDFRDPHITFLVNTGGNACRLMYEVYESQKFANHVDIMATSGEWQWVSIPIGRNVSFSDWGSNGWDGDDADGELDYTKIRYIQIGMGTGDLRDNGYNAWEINMDNFQITDGAVSNPTTGIASIYTFWDFEDSQDPWVFGTWQSGVTATSSINGGGLTAPQGNSYLEVVADVVTEGWNWYGNLEMYDLNIDLSETLNPHLNFWANTLGGEYTFEAEIGDANGGKWGTNFSVTGDGWTMVSLNLNTMSWGNWGAETDAPDLSKITHIKLGYNANNRTGTFKTYVDNIMLTNGPVFHK